MERWMIISAAVIGALLVLDTFLFIAARRENRRRAMVRRLEQVVGFSREENNK